MRRYILITSLICNSLMALAQGPVGTWADHLPYHAVYNIAAGKSEVIGSTEYALTIYNNEYQELRKLSKVNGLTDCGISSLAYSSATDSYIIGYTNTNIDILHGTNITNLPDIYNKYIAGNKVINRIRTIGSYAYIATSFGIVVIDMERMEVYDTWNPSADGGTNPVYDLTVMGSQIFAATEKGLFWGYSSNPGLSFFGNWRVVEGTIQGKLYNSVVSIDDRLFFNSPEEITAGDILFMMEETSISPVFNIPGTSIRSIEESSDKLIVSAGSKVFIFGPTGLEENEVTTYGWANPNASNAIMDGNVLYIADNDAGIVTSADLENFESFIPPGPYLNSNNEIFYYEGNIYVSGGAVDNAWNNLFSPLQIHLFTDRQWTSKVDYDSWDALRIRPFPGDPGRIFVSSWGGGLFEYNDGIITNHYDDSNSPLQTIIPGEQYVRICGLAFDQYNNLWITQSGVEGSIKVLKNDGSWIILPYTISAPTIGDILISSSGNKWIVLPRGHGLFLLDDNFTPENFSDDRYKRFIPKDQDGNPLPNIYSIDEDMDGNVWIGTDQGPAVIYTPDLMFDRDVAAYRIKIPRNDGTGLADYLLGTETITSISADGGNRKWFGTNSSGVYLLSEDATKLIRNYNSSNSPLLSDNVTSVEVDGKTGEVWIGTSKGIITVRETATAGSDMMNHVYAYPNPVRNDYSGEVTITGLMTNSNVKITDIGGTLVYETTSLGGQASWNLINYRGSRVSTGVYLIFCSSEDGSFSAVTKLLVIR